MLVRDVAAALSAQLVGDGSLPIERIVHPAAAVKPSDLAVAMTSETFSALAGSKAQVAVISDEVHAACRPEGDHPRIGRPQFTGAAHRAVRQRAIACRRRASDRCCRAGRRAGRGRQHRALCDDRRAQPDRRRHRNSASGHDRCRRRHRLARPDPFRCSDRRPRLDRRAGHHSGKCCDWFGRLQLPAACAGEFPTHAGRGSTRSAIS